MIRRKKGYAALLLVCSMLFLLQMPIRAANDLPQTNAKAALLMEASTGKVLYEKKRKIFVGAFLYYLCWWDLKLIKKRKTTIRKKGKIKCGKIKEGQSG